MRYPPLQNFWYDLARSFFRMGGLVVYRLRVHDQRLEPKTGSVLVVSNHQSLLDPVLIGITCHRRLNYIARATLFNFAPLGWFIQSVGGIPIDQDGSGLSGIKETLRRLKRGEMVLVFPEGTRTKDGKLAPLKSGFCTLARRGNVQILPIAIEGTYDAWPRGQRFPRPGVVQVQFGEPIPSSVIAEMSDEELVAEVTHRIRACQTGARRAVRRARRINIEHGVKMETDNR